MRIKMQWIMAAAAVASALGNLARAAVDYRMYALAKREEERKQEQCAQS